MHRMNIICLCLGVVVVGLVFVFVTNAKFQGFVLLYRICMIQGSKRKTCVYSSALTKQEGLSTTYLKLHKELYKVE